MSHAPNIYVEAPVRTALETLIHFTQSPLVHARWDLRFTSIDHLLRPDPALPQRFHYSRRTRLGIKFSGEGEIKDTVRHSDDHWSYSVRFWSVNRGAFIRSGTGTWRYVIDGDQVHLLTDYDYDVRYGWLGEVADRLVFRPFLGWATAWSFDCLRLWLEEGIPPDLSVNRFRAHVTANVVLAVLWFYQAATTALLSVQPHMLTLRSPLDVLVPSAPVWLPVLAVAQCLFGVLFLLIGNRRLHVVNIAVLALAAFASLAVAPGALAHILNPLVPALAMSALSVVTYMNAGKLAHARRCRRSPSPLALPVVSAPR